MQPVSSSLLNRESLAPLSLAKGAIRYDFERVVLRMLPTEARADDPLPLAGAEEKGKRIHSKMDIEAYLLGRREHEKRLVS